MLLPMLLLATLIGATPTAAGDAALGHDLAAQHCSRCHNIGPDTSASPETNAPPFATLGRDWPVSALQEALAEGILVAHADPPMPEFEFTPAQVDALIAYLETLGGS